MAIKIFVFLIFIARVFNLSVAANEGCSLEIKKDFTYQHPLILHSTKNEFILPNVKNGIQLSVGQNLRLACPGQNNRLSISTAKEVTVTCVSNKTFTVNDGQSGNRNFKDLRCVNYPEPTARRTGKKCSVKYIEVEIGFNTNKGFVPLITNCFDEINKDSLYSRYNLSSKIKSQQFSVPRPDGFIEGDFYKDLYPPPTTLYGKRSQRTALERLLRSTELAEKYISMTTDYFMSRGHLTANADFIYASQQRATFFYVNVAPQWHTFNANNWNEVEKSTRNFANKRNLNLIVYTGVYGHSKLPDINNKNQNLSLFVDKNNRQAITIPEVYWKVLHDPISKKGIALIGHNNPYEKNVTTLCKDISNKLDWLSWDAKNVTAGISYSCDFMEFKKVVDFMPDIPILGLLT